MSIFTLQKKTQKNRSSILFPNNSEQFFFNRLSATNSTYNASTNSTSYSSLLQKKTNCNVVKKKSYYRGILINPNIDPYRREELRSTTKQAGDQTLFIRKRTMFNYLYKKKNDHLLCPKTEIKEKVRSLCNKIPSCPVKAEIPNKVITSGENILRVNSRFTCNTTSSNP